jgi:exonuclease III
VDICLLAECPEDAENILPHLEDGFAVLPRDIAGAKEKIEILYRADVGELLPLFNNLASGVRVVCLRLVGIPEVNIAGVHFPSKVNLEGIDQALVATSFMSDLQNLEAEFSNDRTILVGDLNMNPYEAGVVGAQTIHGVMSREVARRGERVIGGRTYKFFYNPMWGCFGDRTPGPAGTYFLSSTKPTNAFWQIYDQVLLRPSLMDSLRALQILDSDGQESLLTRSGRPGREGISDHLPIFFEIDL